MNSSVLRPEIKIGTEDAHTLIQFFESIINEEKLKVNSIVVK